MKLEEYYGVGYELINTYIEDNIENWDRHFYSEGELSLDQDSGLAIFYMMGGDQITIRLYDGFDENIDSYDSEIFIKKALGDFAVFSEYLESVSSGVEFISDYEESEEVNTIEEFNDNLKSILEDHFG